MWFPASPLGLNIIQSKYCFRICDANSYKIWPENPITRKKKEEHLRKLLESPEVSRSLERTFSMKQYRYVFETIVGLKGVREFERRRSDG